MFDIKRVNAQILNTEKRYGKDSQIVKRIYNTINLAYGTEGKTRFTKSADGYTFRQITVIQNAIDTVSNSAYTSNAGRKRMRENWKASFLEDRPYATDADAEKLLDFFENSVDWNRIRELAGKGYSGQLVENLRELDKEDLDKIDTLFSVYINSTYKDDFTFNELIELISYGMDVDDIINEIKNYDHK